MGDSEGHLVTSRLLAEGYIEVSTPHDGVAHFNVTLKGGALACASATRPIKRATADRLVRAVIQAAEAVNVNPSYFYRVSKLLAFGSYLSDSPTLGDVDLAVELKPRLPSKGSMVDAILEYATKAQETGKRLPTLLHRVNWPSEEVLRLLKGSSKAISLHLATDGVLDNAPTRLVYQHTDA